MAQKTANQDARGIDHIVLVVRDLDAARGRFEAFGFTTTPRSEHPFGTGNSLVQLNHSFIELLTVVDADKLVPMDPDHFSFSAYNAYFLDRREAMSALVLSSADARGDNDGWRARGIKTYEPVDFSRQATMADGRRATVAFTIAFAVDPTMPDAVFFVCQQHRPENFWQPVYQSHANGACEITGAIMCAADPGGHEDFFRAMAPEGTITRNDDGMRIELPRGRVDVRRPEACGRLFPDGIVPPVGNAPGFISATVAVRRLDAVTTSLERGGIPFVSAADSIYVDAGNCFGMVLEFTEAA